MDGQTDKVSYRTKFSDSKKGKENMLKIKIFYLKLSITLKSSIKHLLHD